MPTTSTTHLLDTFDRAIAREHATWTEAADRQALLAAGRAAALVAAALPGTHTLIFSYDHDATWFGAILEAVRGPAGELLWYGDVEVDDAEVAALHARGGPTVTHFDERTGAALGQALARPADLDRPHFRRCTITGADPGDEPSGLVALDVPAAVQAAEQALTPTAITFDELADLLHAEPAVLDPDDVAPLVDALRTAMAGGTGQPSRQQRALHELRTLLRDWRQYDDAALIGLIEELLTHYGFWGDNNHDAAMARRARYAEGVDPKLCAYDGSNEPQKRALTGRDRDILTRLLNDILFALQRGGADAARVHQVVRIFGEADVQALAELRFVLDPRNT
jgi:hypothetical protein